MKKKQIVDFLKTEGFTDCKNNTWSKVLNPGYSTIEVTLESPNEYFVEIYRPDYITYTTILASNKIEPLELLLNSLFHPTNTAK